MNYDARIYVAGHTGLVGSALMRLLKKRGYHNLITHSFEELDLRNQHAVMTFFKQERPEYVFLAAAKVGGIKANSTYPASFLYDNIMIEANCIHAAYSVDVKKLLFLGSSCIYPRLSPQPICEEYLLTGELEKTNEAYAVAKIAGILLCKSYNQQYATKFIACMPTNLYGPYDNFDLESSHVIPALIAKMHKAKKEQLPQVSLWGTGKPRREFLYVDDLAEACLFLMHYYKESMHINVGTGIDISIAKLAQLVKEVVDYDGTIMFNHNDLDGTPQKVLNIEKLKNLGWYASTSLKEGLKKTYKWYFENNKRVCKLKKGAQWLHNVY